MRQYTLLALMLVLLALRSAAATPLVMPAGAVLVPGGARLWVTPPAATLRVCVQVRPPAVRPPCQEPGRSLFIADAVGGTPISVYAFGTGLSLIATARVTVKWPVYLPVVFQAATGEPS